MADLAKQITTITVMDLSTDTEASLAAMYQGYTDHEGLPPVSADELIHHDLTPQQRAVVSIFILRWDAMRQRTETADKSVRQSTLIMLIDACGQYEVRYG